MSPFLLLRLVLDFLAVGLLMVAMAYWWLDNRTHELVGTAMFALLVLHNIFNRRWWGSLPRTRRQPMPVATLVLNFTLAATMVALLITSLLISRSLFGFLFIGGPTARDLHILAAYWGVIIAAIHLGMHWPVIMGVAARLAGITRLSQARRVVLRILAAGVAMLGVLSFLGLDIASRLLLVPTIVFWDFNEDATGFFLRLGAIAGLAAVIGHYGLIILQALQCRRRAAA
ncbi:DUF4405 domain-containing protein [Rhizobium jaguaris]|uniref:DUF4405 domain-containing protein n=1 Tax=Rhizobium jaguaris TaxID=1312183 RepID=A0A387G281_9HYPH|nr:DUF4405 domain-containing protein [Rhizobium jaguaris]AYG62291.1 DUF4405 domain-containing protein [Rhizobium jaguaris]